LGARAAPSGLRRGLHSNRGRADGAELGKFIAVGIGLPLGLLGAGAQVRAQFLALAGGVSAGLAQHLGCVGRNPLGLRLAGTAGRRGEPPVRRPKPPLIRKGGEVK
jgi:hypothetical protein